MISVWRATWLPNTSLAFQLESLRHMLRSGIVNQHEIRVVGLSRSGNHAIIHSIFEQSPGRVCFLNCCEPKTNPFQTAREMGDGRRAKVNYDDFDLEQEASGVHTAKDVLIYSYEDCFISTICHKDFEQSRSKYLGGSQLRYDLLILRDPFNLFASRIRSRFGGVTPKTAGRIWKQHAKQFLGLRKHFTQNFIPVNYNRWATSEPYRRHLAETLQLAYNKEAAYHIPSTGGGSSFSLRKHHGEAHKLNVTGRWRYFQEDEEYLGLFDEEMITLSDKIFGLVEDSDEFRAFRDRLLSR